MDNDAQTLEDTAHAEEIARLYRDKEKTEEVKEKGESDD